jgi:hypothetical protein
MELRGAQDRINQLEAEVELFRDRAARAERWLQTIHKEIEEKLIARDWPPAPNKNRLHCSQVWRGYISPPSIAFEAQRALFRAGRFCSRSR